MLRGEAGLWAMSKREDRVCLFAAEDYGTAEKEKEGK